MSDEPHTTGNMISPWPTAPETRSFRPGLWTATPFALHP
jgi:hypothetical protein